MNFRFVTSRFITRVALVDGKHGEGKFVLYHRFYLRIANYWKQKGIARMQFLKYFSRTVEENMDTTGFVHEKQKKKIKKYS